MEKKIIIERGLRKKIAEKVGCTPDYVGQCLKYDRGTEKSSQIREVALSMGGNYARNAKM